MAGHSKWANIKHRKAASDAKRSRVWSKLLRAVTVAAKLGDPDPAYNPRLRQAVDEARATNCPNDNIDRAIKKGSGGGAGSEDWVTLTYEGYGPGGVAMMVECLTDNRNRTAGEVRSTFSKRGGNLGTDGSVSYLFQRKGMILFDQDAASEDKIMEVGLDHGLENLEKIDGGFEVTCAVQDLQSLKDAFEAAGLGFKESQIAMIPTTYAEITDEHAARKLLGLIDAIEDLDDVQKVHSNHQIAEDILAKIEG